MTKKEILSKLEGIASAKGLTAAGEVQVLILDLLLEANKDTIKLMQGKAAKATKLSKGAKEEYRVAIDVLVATHTLQDKEAVEYYIRYMGYTFNYSDVMREYKKTLKNLYISHSYGDVIDKFNK